MLTTHNTVNVKKKKNGTDVRVPHRYTRATI